MQIKFIGAAGAVTGSKTILNHNSDAYLIDAGLYQGEFGETQKNLIPIRTEDLRNLKGVFITHAHLDHCGYLPYLVGQGYSGPIFMTEATKNLVQIVLEDAFSILELDFKDKKIEVMPYSEDDLAKVFSMIVIKDKNNIYDHEKLSFKFIEAGHILGACSLWVDWNGKRTLFSGDLGREKDLVHVPAEICTEEVDTVVIEGTYGGRNHSDESSDGILKEAIEYVHQKEGVLLIPCFAIARSAVVLKVLSDFFKKCPSKKLKIFVDSPMMIKALNIYLKYSDQLKIDKNELNEILDQVKMVEYPKDRKKLSKHDPPYILLSSSGMLSGGRSSEHFERLALKDFNFILFVGYQGVGTLGRKVVDGERSFMAYGKVREIKARVAQLTQLSAHADENEMVEYLRNLKINTGKIFINHAEPKSAKLFYERLTRELGADVLIAEEKMSYEI